MREAGMGMGLVHGWGARIATVLLIVLSLTGCATTAPAGAPAGSQAASAPVDGGAAPTATAPASPQDPWERWNRKVYAFNDALDVAVIKPVAVAYTKVVPQPIRTSVTNFYGNFADVWSAVNNVLQGKVTNGLQDVARVGTNTLLGIGGLFDVASEFGLDSQREDFGQTLGHWGVAPGPFVMWPILGPSTVRDSVALPLDRYVSPTLLVSATNDVIAVTALGLLNDRANLLPTSRLLDDMALDKYSFIRDGYLQRRRSLVHDGNAPDEVEPADKEATEAPSASGPAPASPSASALAGEKK
ncbi:MAG: hypothetical protein RLZZ618_1871 [Pseudomonadota bacterium]|jgi:phospholipid-binding lipoprotein MlaA